MGGFTRPKDLRSANWWPGGPYESKGKVYESPPEAAYEPHTVFLLESRYPVKHGIGRVDSHDHVVGVCREGDFEAVLKRYNSVRAPREELEAMDNARWPWGPQYQLKRTKWWAAGENPQEIIKELFGEAGIDAAYMDESGKFEGFEEEVEEDLESARQPVGKNKKSIKANAPTSLISSLPATPTSIEQRRMFHSSTRSFGAHSYNEDHIVPDFYVQHKRRKNPDSPADAAPVNAPDTKTSKSRQGSAIAESLMEHLSDSILSDEVAASTMKRIRGKVPHEHYNEEGILVHPSGYVVPTPGVAPNPMSERRERDLTRQTAAVAERVLEDGDFSTVNAHTRLQDGKVPYEVIEEDGSVSHPSGFVPPTAQHAFKYSDSSSVDNHVQDSVQRQRRRASTIHLSAEEMEERQRKSDAIVSRDEDDAELVAALRAGLKEAASKATGNSGQKRGIHTSAVARAREVANFPFDHDSEVDRSIPPHMAGPVAKNPAKFPRSGKAPKARSTPIVHAEVPQEVKDLREKYIPTLAENPFWRPLLSMTVSTRPIATTLARLARAHPRGLAFYASISNDDRKTHASYPDRMRNMRIDRMTSLSVQTAQLLAGARGGFIGIRFGTQDRGRGIGGEGFEAPLPKEKRTIKIGVGNWYPRAAEVKEAFSEDAKTHVGEVGVGLEDIGETFDIAGLDDHGRRIDDKTGEVVPWAEAKPIENPDFFDAFKYDAEAAAEGETDGDVIAAWKNEHAAIRAKKIRRQELAREHKYEIATHLAQKHRSVISP